MTKIIIGVVIVTIVLLVVMTQVDNYSTNLINGETTTLVSNNEAKFTATITGEVLKPGTYTISDKSILADLVSAASGLTTNADDKAFNLSYEITSNNMSFYIAPVYDNTSGCAVSPIVKVNINSANKEELMTISAIGDSVATKIVSYRETSLFYRLEDIKNVSGIGSATFEKIKNYITLE